MGISGLLPMLKEIQEHGHISQFKGKRLAVDAYVWLHKGAFGCAEQIVKGEKTTRFVDYAMHRVRLLRHYGIAPYIVFDGGPLPAKMGTEVSRAKSREESLVKAQSFESQGRMKEARDFYTKCLDITPEMAYQLIKALRSENVEYVVAPYEADAQLYFLEREGYVDGIITEDSDLLVFGGKLVVFKLDGNGQCVSIRRDQLSTLNEFPMHGWSDMQFRRMAMLSGCDYLPSIPGIGIKTAHRLLRRYKTVEKLLQHLRLEGTHDIPASYAIDYAQAELAFIHQRVFHPLLQRLVPLNDFPKGGLTMDDEKWIGLDITAELALGIAKGDIHPETREPIVDLWPAFKPSERCNIQRSVSYPKLQVLQDTSKANVRSGPMDAFISRTRRTASLPLPKPIGYMSSGPSRLSDQHLFSSRSRVTTEAGSNKVQRSKFFSYRENSMANRLEETIQREVAELVWESSDDAVMDRDVENMSNRISPPAENFPTSCSLNSPTKLASSPGLDREVDETQLTSPIGSRDSSPALSSPVHNFDDFIGLERSQRSCSPAQSVHSARPSRNFAQTLIAVSPGSLMTPRLSSQTPVKETRSLGSVLIPTSSPPPPLTDKLCSEISAEDLSSDDIGEEVIVTPSADILGKRKRGYQQGKVKQEEGKPIEDNVDHASAEMDVELQRAERAKIVAAGWKAKYSLHPATAFPRPRTTRINSGRKTASDPVFSPPPKRVLAPRQLNVPHPSEPMSRMFPPGYSDQHKNTMDPKRTSPLNRQESSKMAWSSLERFKFTGKIDMDQP